MGFSFIATRGRKPTRARARLVPAKHPEPQVHAEQEYGGVDEGTAKEAAHEELVLPFELVHNSRKTLCFKGFRD